MKTKNIVIIIIVIALVGIGAWALLGGKIGIKEGLVPIGEEAVTPEEGAEETGLSLTEILGKATGLSSLKYDAVVTAPGEVAVTTKMWWKGEKMRMEGTFEGKTMVYLIDMGEGLAYIYFPADNTAIEMDLAEAQESIGESPTEQSESVTQYNPVTLGTEVLDGKNCRVIEYTAEAVKTKSWVWIDYGLIIKIESTTDEGTSVFELKNIDFGAIPDSMFELPAGVQMMEIPFLGL